MADGYPQISGSLVVETQNDYTYDSDDPGGEINDLFTTTEPEIIINFTENLYSINTWCSRTGN